MRRHKSLLAAFRIATIVAALALLAFHASSHRIAPVDVLFFIALVGVATFIRVPFLGKNLGFESAVAIPAIMIFGNADIAFIALMVGGAAYVAYRAIRERHASVELLSESAQLALAYDVAGLFYYSLISPRGSLLSRIGGYVLIIGALTIARLFFFFAASKFEGEDPNVGQFLARHGRALLLITPIILVEVLVYPHYGPAGLLLAFLPVLLVAYVMQNESDADRRSRALLRRNQQLSILSTSSTNLLTAEGEQETLTRLSVHLSQLARMKACAVVTWGTEIPLTVYRFGECLRSDQAIEKWVHGSGFAEAAPKNPLVLRDRERDFPLSDGSAHQLIFGIQTPEVIYGVLIFETADRAVEQQEMLTLFSILVSQTALSLQDQLLRREMQAKTIQLEKQAETMSKILGVSGELIGLKEIDTVLPRIAEAIKESLGFQRVTFSLLDDSGALFVPRAHAGLEMFWEEVSRKKMPASEIRELCREQFRISNSFFVPHSRFSGEFFFPDEDEPPREHEWHPRDRLLVPLASGDQTIGYLSVDKPLDKKAPTLERVQTVEIFANQAVTAIQSARQYEEIKRLTYIDTLTASYNLRYFNETLVREIVRAERKGHQFALAMLDIDNFKRYNDTYGHPVGDRILQGLVEELNGCVREMDVVARYGGEEFAIIFPETAADLAFAVADRLREKIEQRRFEIANIAIPLHITVSFGVAIFPDDARDPDSLVSRADEALYFAKKNGKNQVAMAHGLGVVDASAV